MKKMTFTLDDESVRELERAAQRLSIPKSQVIREAVSLYGDQLGRLNEEERKARLDAFDRLVPAIPDRPRKAVEKELDEIQKARRGGGRGSG